LSLVDEKGSRDGGDIVLLSTFCQAITASLPAKVIPISPSLQASMRILQSSGSIHLQFSNILSLFWPIEIFPSKTSELLSMVAAGRRMNVLYPLTSSRCRFLRSSTTLIQFPSRLITICFSYADSPGLRFMVSTKLQRSMESHGNLLKLWLFATYPSSPLYLLILEIRRDSKIP